MEDKLTVQNKWEFKRRDIHFESSRIAKSKLSVNPKPNKHRSVSSLTSLKNDRNVNANANPFSMDAVKILMESLLEDLSRTREKLFVWMREEVEKLVAEDDMNLLPVKQVGQPENHIKSEKLDQDFNDEKLIMGSDTNSTSKANGFINSYQPCKNQVDASASQVLMASTKTQKGERFGVGTADRKFQFSPVDEYLRICGKRKNPSAKKAQNSSLSPLGSVEKGKAKTDSLQKLVPTVSRNVSCFEQNGRFSLATGGAGFPVPLHKAMTSSFGFQSQVGLESLGQEKCNGLFPSAHGAAAIRSYGGIYALSDDHVPTPSQESEDWS